jgi:hypothetical protein
LKDQKAFDFKEKNRVSYFKMILLLLSFSIFSISDANNPITWGPGLYNFAEWSKAQVFIFYTQHPLEFDYPDCFGTLLTPSLVLTIASCFIEVRDIKTISIVKVTS